MQAMKREARLKELKALDEARKRYLHHQQAVKEEEVAQLDKDIQKKVGLQHVMPDLTCIFSSPHLQIVQRDLETQAAVEDIELRTLELQAQRALLEQELRQRHDEAMYRLRADHAARLQREDVEQELTRRRVEEDVDREGSRVRDAQVRLAQAQSEREEEELSDQVNLQDLGQLQGGLRQQEVRNR